MTVPALRLLSILCLLCLGADLAAQTAGRSVSGSVRTADGAPLEKTWIELSGAVRRTTTTDENGAFTLTGIPAGTYTLTARRIGYRVLRREVIVDGVIEPLSIALDEQPIETPDVVVTATKSARASETSPVPLDIISGEEIERRKHLLLCDLLAEQTGIDITHDHGAGVQLQGLDADYTLILLDGEPMIGRTAGTLDLRRITLDNVRKVEIIKGPSSSLYGSEALAGVINIITRAPGDDFEGSARLQYGTNNTADIYGGIGIAWDELRAGLTLQRLSSSGYDLDPRTVSPTVAPFVVYTVQPRLEYRASERLTLSTTSRIAISSQSSLSDLLVDADTLRVDDRSHRSEWSVTQTARYQISNSFFMTGRLHGMRYTTTSTLGTSLAEYYRDEFDQLQLKGEAQAEALLSASHMLTAGLGYVSESVRADRLIGGGRSIASYFLFAQNEWSPSSDATIVAGARFDAHQDYGTRLSPKIAAMLRPRDWLTLRASVGSGFKAPTFQQLYLSFTNPSVGYTVFGSTGVIDGVRRLEEEGSLQRMLMSLDRIAPLRSEHSIALNIGGDLNMGESVRLTANLFLNDIKDLIETAPIAVRTNGQSVFTYFNLNHVITRGIESELRLDPIDGLQLTLGYQLLDAYEVQTLDRVRGGEISKVGSTGRLRAVQEVEYGGLFNRSRHSASIRLSFDDESLGLGAALRGVLRGRYGYADRNSNGILDDDAEYAPGYTLWNLTVTQRVAEYLVLHGSIENLFDHRDGRLPELHGRLFNIGLSFTHDSQ